MRKLALVLPLVLLAATLSHAQQYLPIVSGAVTIPAASGTYKVLLNANVSSAAFAGTPQPYAQSNVTVIFAENATGGFTVAFSGITNPCTVTTTASAVTTCQFTYDSTSSTWIGVGGGSGSATFATLTNGTNTNTGLFLFQQPGVFTSTQYNLSHEYALTGGAGSCPIDATRNNTAAITACLNGPATGDAAALNVGVESYVTINDPTQDSSNPNQANVAGFGLRGNCTSAVNNTVCEGLYVTAQDTSGKTGTLLVGDEVDVSATNASTTGYGLELLSIGTQQLTANVLPAIYVQPFGSGTSKWTSGLTCGATAIYVQNTSSAPCMVLAPQASGASAKSNTIQFISTTGGSVQQPLDIFSVSSASSGRPLLTSLQSYDYVADSVWGRGVAQVSGNIALSAGWGTTATVSSVSGYNQRMRFTVTSNGTGQAGSPTITITYSEASPFTPLCMAVPQGGTGTQANLFPGTESATTSGAMVWQGGTPAAGSTYIFLVDCRL